VTAARLREVLDYNPETGIFTNRIRRGSKGAAGAEAGTLTPTGYRNIVIDGRLYPAHRLAWLYVHGTMPKWTIDHINHRRDDNRIANLRDVPHRENCQNREARITPVVQIKRRTVAYPHPGEILKEEFLDPMGLTAYRLSKAINVPQTRIGDILAGERSITADTGLRLARFFGTSDEFWIKLQMDYDTAMTREQIGAQLEQIQPWTQAA